MYTCINSLYIMLLHFDFHFVNPSEPGKLSEREKLRLLGYVAMCLYYKSRKAFGSKLMSPPRAQEAHIVSNKQKVASEQFRDQE